MEFSSSSDRVLGQRDNNGKGDPAATHELLVILRGYRPHIFRFLLASFGDPDLAKVLTQRCVEAAFREWNEGDDQALSRKSLMRFAVNLERRHWLIQQLSFWRKTDVKTAGLVHLNDWLPCDQKSIIDQIGRRDEVKRIWCAVCGLSNEQRIVFLLHCVDEMTSSEIAEVTDLHRWAVNALLVEALTAIRMTGTQQEGPQ